MQGGGMGMPGGRGGMGKGGGKGGPGAAQQVLRVRVRVRVRIMFRPSRYLG